jgi:hypothetical protein
LSCPPTTESRLFNSGLNGWRGNSLSKGRDAWATKKAVVPLGRV